MTAAVGRPPGLRPEALGDPPTGDSLASPAEGAPDLVNDIELFRLTMLGGAGCGKTALVSAFVNNFCPMVYTPTEDPTLYYKATSVLRDGPSEEDMPALVEVEDTYASNLYAARGAAPPKESPRNADRYRQQRDVRNFFKVVDKDVSADTEGAPVSALPVLSYESNETRESEASSINVPANAILSAWQAPTHHTYRPITRKRMGFLIVYDSTDEGSLFEALEIHKEIGLSFDAQLQRGQPRPIVFLVANKADKDPIGADFLRMKGHAERYADAKDLKLHTISALELKQVRRLFAEILQQIRHQPGLRPKLPVQQRRPLPEVSPTAMDDAPLREVQEHPDAGAATFEEHFQAARKSAEQNCVAQ